MVTTMRKRTSQTVRESGAGEAICTLGTLVT